MLKRQITPVADSERGSKRTRMSDESDNINVLPTGYSDGQSSSSFEYLPKAVVMTLNQGSLVKSMDFHPVQKNLLLVGTNTGDVTIWDLGSRQTLFERKFKVRMISSCSPPLKEFIINQKRTPSVTRVTWSPDGTQLGVAYSKNIVHIFSYHGDDDIRLRLEIEGHQGSVNDLAFCNTKFIVTCGDDKLIRVWCAIEGARQKTYKGHEAPVYSVCPHFKGNNQFIISTAIDGKIKMWSHDKTGPRVVCDAPRIACDAPGPSPTTMLYGADGTRLFLCGGNKEGDAYIGEWNETEGGLKRMYNGLSKRGRDLVKFDTANRFIAAGDENLVKFWDMDNINLLTTIDAEGSLPVFPCVRFDKEGMLLAGSTNKNGIKILGNPDGVRILETVVQNRSSDTSRVVSGSFVKILGRTVFVEETTSCGLEISEPSQCCFSRLPDVTSSAMRVTRLIYTNSGDAVLALAADAVHKLWKWQKDDCNSTGKATASISSHLWQPTSSALMTNDITDTNQKDAIACFALSNNDGYLMSASGGKIWLFNMITFEAMTTLMPPPPAATYLTMHPQNNNIVAIGMDDSSIIIYNVKAKQVKTKLNGHHKRITGLAFSNVLNVLVSSGADSRLCMWSCTDEWKQLIYKQLQNSVADTRVEFHQDQTQLLVYDETRISIFDARRLECLKQWGPREASGVISHATYSCDSQLIYVTLEDGSINVLASSRLRLHCHITSSAYLPRNLTSKVYPLVVAAHPSKPNQFALGLTDGGVCIIEPLESEKEWSRSPGLESGAGPSTTLIGAANTTDQALS